MTAVGTTRSRNGYDRWDVARHLGVAEESKDYQALRAAFEDLPEDPYARCSVRYRRYARGVFLPWWFAHARGGRLDQLVEGWFDLSTAGDKRASASYERIARAVGARPAEIVFLTDSPAELDAATAAGWSVVGVGRPGEPAAPTPPHAWVPSFADVKIVLAGGGDR